MVIINDYKSFSEKMFEDDRGTLPQLNQSFDSEQLYPVIRNNGWVSVLESPMRNPFEIPQIPSRNNGYPSGQQQQHQRRNDHYRMDDMQRRLVAERFTTKIMNRLISWFERTDLFRTSINYANQWRSKMSNNPSYVMNERALSNPYEARLYNYGHYNQGSAIYSRHESFIRNIVDSIITFKRMLASAAGIATPGQTGDTQSEEYQDKQLAEDIANRIDRYTYQERRGRNQFSNQQYTGAHTNVRILDRLRAVLDGFLTIFRSIYLLVFGTRNKVA